MTEVAQVLTCMTGEQYRYETETVEAARESCASGDPCPPARATRLGSGRDTRCEKFFRDVGNAAYPHPGGEKPRAAGHRPPGVLWTTRGITSEALWIGQPHHLGLCPGTRHKM